MLILRIEDRVYGTIVDKIDKVVGINTSTIQPPHPIFGDINIKFISGVVEKQGDLYIILDVVRIFTTQKEEDKQKSQPIQEGNGYFMPPAAAQTPVEKPPVSDSDLGFIQESLFALRQFSVSNVNEFWLRKRFAEWSSTRSGAELQLRNANDADEFLGNFYSPCNGIFWDDDYAGMVGDMLPDMPSNNIQIWNLGCGKGYESFSFACILKQRYPNGHIKIWAHDNDIMAISQAPNMIFNLEDIPEYCRAYMTKGRNGYSFNQIIKDAIVFEYHDILNENALPDLDIILGRDILSFFPPETQTHLIAFFMEKLKKRGVVILGANEQLPESEWRSIGKEPISTFIRA
jgi:purine-binding chemotaxis protein CheW